MKWAKCLAAAIVLTLGVFVSAIPAASIQARAQTVPFATDTDDDSDALAQQQNEAAEQQTQLDEQLASPTSNPGNSCYKYVLR